MRSKAIQSTINKIMNDYSIDLIDIESERRFNTILEPRWLCWHIYRCSLQYSLEDIAWEFNRKDHTSIMNGLKQVKKSYPDMIKEYEEYYLAEKEKEKDLAKA